MPTARDFLGVAAVNGKIYAIGGQTSSGTYLRTNEMYDPATDNWTTLAPMPTSRSRFGITVYQNKIYCIGGLTGVSTPQNDQIVTNANQAYDPATNLWTIETPMPIARQGIVAQTVNGKIYAISGGKVTSGYNFDGMNYNEVYNPNTGSWTTAAPIPQPLAGSASCVVGDEIFVIGGAWNYPQTNNQIYNVKTDNWTSGQPIPMTDGTPAAGVITDSAGHSRLFVVGNFKGDSIPTQVYDVTTGNWINATQMPTSRNNLGVAVVNGNLYAIGGTPGGPETNVNEMYTPSAYAALTPTPLPSPSPTPSPSSSPTPTPAASQQPTQSPQPNTLQAEILITATGAVVVVAVAVVAIVFRRRK